MIAMRCSYLNLPLLLINLTPEEQIRYSSTALVFYPNIVSLSQIYSMMSQRLVEDRLTFLQSGRMFAVCPNSRQSILNCRIDPITHLPMLNMSGQGPQTTMDQTNEGNTEVICGSFGKFLENVVTNTCKDRRGV